MKQGWWVWAALASLESTAVSRAQESAPAPVQTSVDATALRRIDVETHTPMRVITRRDLAALSGHQSLGQVLQRLPYFGASVPNLNSNASGDGSVLADVGGVGRARTVVMLNGMRLPANELLGAPAVNLDAIPLAAVDRIEISLGGASPTWGSDAVAGVINVITRSETEGLEISAASAVTSRGDGAVNRAAAAGGKVFGRGYTNFALEVFNENPIDSSERAFGARTEGLGCANVSSCIWPAGSPATANGDWVVSGANALGLPAGRYTFDNGGYRPFRTSGPDNDFYDTQHGTYLRAGRKGIALSANGEYEFSSTTPASWNFLASHNRVRRRLAPATISATNAYSSVVQLPDGTFQITLPGVAADNYYNPFGMQISDATLRLAGAGPRTVTDDGTTIFLAGSLKHYFGKWQFDSSLGVGWSGIAERDDSAIDFGNLTTALGPSVRDANGEIRCAFRNQKTGALEFPWDDCVSLDLFHGQQGVTPQMLDYVLNPSSDTAEVLQMQLNLIGRREFLRESGAPLARLLIGIESRTLSPDYTFGFPDLSEFRKDYIAELSFPLLHSDSIGDVLTLTAGGRATDASNGLIGSSFLAVAWRPDSRWLTRARVAQLYRPASAEEQFIGQRRRTILAGNPCAEAANHDSALCQYMFGADTAGAAAPLEVNYFAYPGNNNYWSERGWTVSTGVVWNSFEHRDRVVSLDVTRVDLKNAIRYPAPLEAFDLCNSIGDPRLCYNIVPSKNGGTFNMTGDLLSGGHDRTSRLDLEVSDAGTTRLGNWRANLLAAYLLERKMQDTTGRTVNLRGTYDIVHSVTGTAYPALQWTSSLQWTWDRWSANWIAQYIDSYWETGDRYGWLTPQNGSSRRVSSILYNDFSLSWTSKSAFSIRAGVENIFDRAPPRVNSALEANTDAPTYRLEGRLFSVGVDFAR